MAQSRYTLADGYEEAYQDGRVQKIDINGVISIEGIDGIKKIKYPDGKEEIIMANNNENYENNNNYNNMDIGFCNDIELRNMLCKNNEANKMNEFIDKIGNNDIVDKNNENDNNIYKTDE